MQKVSMEVSRIEPVGHNVRDKKGIYFIARIRPMLFLPLSVSGSGVPENTIRHLMDLVHIYV